MPGMDCARGMAAVTVGQSSRSPHTAQGFGKTIPESQPRASGRPGLCTAMFPGGSGVKNPLANAGAVSLIPGLGRSPGEGMPTHSSILAWRIPWMKETDRLESIVLQKVLLD